MAEANKLKTLWRGVEVGDIVRYASPWGGAQPLPRISPEEWRQASLLFPAGTAWTYDGFHPRHYALLSETGLEVLSTLVEVSECLGDLPLSARPVTVPLIPKAKGGLRPIGNYSSIRRVWAKARLNVVESWERRNCRAYFASGRGRSAIDTVFRQAASAEAGVNVGESSAAILWDLSSFFDTINLGLLYARAVRFDFPLVLATNGHCIIHGAAHCPGQRRTSARDPPDSWYHGWMHLCQSLSASVLHGTQLTNSSGSTRYV